MKTIRSTVVAAAVLTVAAGCTSTANRVLVTPAPGVESIPSTIAIYPLLTTEYSRIVYGRHPVPQPIQLKATLSTKGEEGKAPEGREEEGIYIMPPTESRLVVTSDSQLFSDLLAAEMTNVGFHMKQLPVEAPVGDDDKATGGQTFYVSMDLLQRLRDEFGLQAVLLGNVYFTRDRYDPSDVEVRAAYVKVVDVRTLDVICHVSVTNDFYGTDISETVMRIADELAVMLPEVPEKD